MVVVGRSRCIESYQNQTCNSSRLCFINLTAVVVEFPTLKSVITTH